MKNILKIVFALMIFGFCENQAVSQDNQSKEQNNLIYALTISKTNYPDEQGTYSMGDAEIQFFNLSIKSMFEMLLEASPMTIEMPADLTKQNFDFYYRPAVKQNFEQYKGKMLEDLCQAMGMTMKATFETRQVYKLKCADCGKLEKQYLDMMQKATKLETKFDDSTGRWKAEVAPIALITRYLETTYKKLFIDETGLKGYFNFDLSKAGLDEVIKDLKKAGIEVVKENTKVKLYKFSAKSGKVE